MGQVSIRDLNDEVIEALKLRAKTNHRSLQNELVVILTQAAKVSQVDSAKLAEQVRQKLAGREHSNSVDLIREDRNR